MANGFLHLGVLQSGEELVWDMEHLNGSAMKDLAGNSRDGTITGAVDTGIGAWGHSRSFNGAGDNIASAAFTPGAAAFTIAFWANPDALRVQGLVGRGNAAASWRVYMSDASGHVTFDAKGATIGPLASTSLLAVGTWAHIAATFDGTTARLYINGKQEASANTADWGNATNDTLVAGRTDTNSFDGKLDEVYFFNRALSAAEIDALGGRPGTLRTRLESPDGTWQVPLPESRVTMDLNRDVTKSSLPGNKVLDIDLMNVMRQFTVVGNFTTVGAHLPIDFFDILENLWMRYIGAPGDTTNRLKFYWGQHSNGTWKTYLVRPMRLTPLHDIQDTGGAPRLFPYTLSLVEGGDLSDKG